MRFFQIIFFSPKRGNFSKLLFTWLITSGMIASWCFPEVFILIGWIIIINSFRNLLWWFQFFKIFTILIFASSDISPAFAASKTARLMELRSIVAMENAQHFPPGPWSCITKILYRKICCPCEVCGVLYHLGLSSWHNS